MESKTITNTQIQGIEAKDLLTHFEKLNNRLDQLQNTVKPQSKTVLLTRKEVAKMLDISLPTLWAWTNKNINPATKRTSIEIIKGKLSRTGFESTMPIAIKITADKP